MLVERIEGLATEAEWRRAYDEINDFERMLTTDGVRLIKVFLHLSAEKQVHRFEETAAQPGQALEALAGRLPQPPAPRGLRGGESTR